MAKRTSAALEQESSPRPVEMEAAATRLVREKGLNTQVVTVERKKKKLFALNSFIRRSSWK